MFILGLSALILCVVIVSFLGEAGYPVPLIMFMYTMLWVVCAGDVYPLLTITVVFDVFGLYVLVRWVYLGHKQAPARCIACKKFTPRYYDPVCCYRNIFDKPSEYPSCLFEEEDCPDLKQILDEKLW